MIAFIYCYRKMKFYGKLLTRAYYTKHEVMSFGQFISQQEILESDFELWIEHEDDIIARKIRFSDN